MGYMLCNNVPERSPFKGPVLPNTVSQCPADSADSAEIWFDPESSKVDAGTDSQITLNGPVIAYGHDQIFLPQNKFMRTGPPVPGLTPH